MLKGILVTGAALLFAATVAIAAPGVGVRVDAPAPPGVNIQIGAPHATKVVERERIVEREKSDRGKHKGHYKDHKKDKKHKKH